MEGALRFPSKEWVDEYVRRVRESEAYRAAAADWEGDLCFVFEAEPDRGVPEPVWVWMDLWHGEVRDHRYGVPPGEGERARYVVRAPYSRWKEVIRGELDPVRGILQGKLKLRGDLATIVRHVQAAHELVTVAASVPTRFVDEDRAGPGQGGGR
ncbi:MAG TPA: SCP2 sterol-binding domain-containing protein [Actinomycetota bacterium]|nr:SCP2 sterol-binding domain-containing protein [Actinomycetota bacterium]